MTGLSPEQYASRVEAVLLRELRRGSGRSISSMPTPEEAAHLILETEAAPGGNPLAERIGPVWSSARTREALGLRSRQALSSRRAHGTVLGVTTHEGTVFYPVFQFRRHGAKVEVRPSLVRALKTLKDVDSWTVAAMLRSQDPELGTSALEWATSGRNQDRLGEWALAVRRELTRP